MSFIFNIPLKEKLKERAYLEALTWILSLFLPLRGRRTSSWHDLFHSQLLLLLFSLLFSLGFCYQIPYAGGIENEIEMQAS